MTELGIADIASLITIVGFAGMFHHVTTGITDVVSVTIDTLMLQPGIADIAPEITICRQTLMLHHHTADITTIVTVAIHTGMNQLCKADITAVITILGKAFMLYDLTADITAVVPIVIHTVNPTTANIAPGIHIGIHAIMAHPQLALITSIITIAINATMRYF
jgi:hypothetical protein